MNRRTLLGLLAAPLIHPRTSLSQAHSVVTKPIPSSGEALPVIGLGSWRTFDVGRNRAARDARTEVMRTFFAHDGRLIDSSPMYGSSQEVIGYGLERLGQPDGLFAADKVWITGEEQGPPQIEASRQHWGVPQFDLMQVHNLRSWEWHLETLFSMKSAGQLRYVGVTTYGGLRHNTLEEIMRAHPLDFIQVSYNMFNRKAEERILPLAQDRGVAVIINRPFQEGVLIQRMERQRLPEWASDAGVVNWAQFLLKFIVSHPAVTCAIPATTRVDHVIENMGAARGHMPEEAMRRRMVAYVEAL